MLRVLPWGTACDATIRLHITKVSIPNISLSSPLWYKIRYHNNYTYSYVFVGSTDNIKLELENNNISFFWKNTKMVKILSVEVPRQISLAWRISWERHWSQTGVTCIGIPFLRAWMTDTVSTPHWSGLLYMHPWGRSWLYNRLSLWFLKVLTLNECIDSFAIQDRSYLVFLLDRR